MKFFAITALVALLATTVAADFVFTSPVEGTKWKRGEDVTISWRDNGHKPLINSRKKIVIRLAYGHHTKDWNGVDGVNVTLHHPIPLKYRWHVPKNLNPKLEYFFVITDNTSDQPMSGYFQVE
ncbi:hypothetical protein BC937DRAFT_91113 [Endogone sp. FLAS-F59071]|nr:hypothetical protein BC937DRAFT_91113 [Endogone sp. FLAS-F59071]|eukprot:RUS16525.1 hypothetical protein BC937DRAFT_91113 [Endogone sp. FLAS-F59071]